MKTKLRAARLAARSGTSTLIASGREADVLTRLRNGEQLGSLLYAEQAPLAARKQWLAGHLQMRGRLELDEGAVKVLRESGRSLLAVGVKGVEGDFARGEMVACLDPQGQEIARGLVNYSADEVRRIMGRPSEAIESILGYIDEPELIHRDNMIMV
jgi:glutamate 5-kinase